MKTLKELCKPRQSVFDRSKRDIVLDISDVIEERIDPTEFFRENYLTDGMKVLFQEAFRRFSGKSDSGVFTLTQAMGGGKTHCMIALALLALYPEFRKEVIGGGFGSDLSDPVKVVAFNGRETDAPYGIWGSIADQLGKKATFDSYYSPLAAPGESAWVNLLRGERLAILLDELPSYLENARSITVGNSDLAVVTSTALANLLVAVGKGELSNVCVVISDLRATYEGGSGQINEALHNFQQEVGRSAIELEPVRLNTDEVYHILKKRLFEEIADPDEITAIAEGYRSSLDDAKQMNLTHVSSDTLAQQIRESYPFHPAIRDLYARFRENPGFQQTRGLLRFMRVVLSDLFELDWINPPYLIHPHMMDLNHRETLAQIQSINPTLGNAISHDIASSGDAAAEGIDATTGRTDAQDVCKLLLVSSLANIENASLGLTDAEICTFLCAPGRDVAALPEIISTLENQACW